jgi:hypothetical protein
MANKVISSINAGSGDIGVFTTPYGVCDTAADTAAKTVTVQGDFALETGARVVVKFTNGNSADPITLNVNNTGAKDVYIDSDCGNESIDSFIKAGYLGRMFEFVYDGTRWQLLTINIDTNTVYTHPTTSGNKHLPPHSYTTAGTYYLINSSTAGAGSWTSVFGKYGNGSYSSILGDYRSYTASSQGNYGYGNYSLTAGT